MNEMISSLRRSWSYFLGHISYHQARAAALTYYTLFAIVPLVVLVLFIARNFFFEKEISLFLLEKFGLEEKVFGLLLLFSMRLIEETKGLFFIGSALLFYIWSSFSLIGRLERHLNKLLRFKEDRALSQKLLAYPLMVLFFPFAALALNLFAFYLSARLTQMAPLLTLFKEIDPLLLTFLQILPSLLTAVLLGIAYFAMPNGKVNWRASFYGGLIAAILYQLFQWGYFYFQVRISHYNVIWGAFAIIPLFLLWLNLSWLIFLLGGEIVGLFNKPHHPFHHDS